MNKLTAITLLFILPFIGSAKTKTKPDTIRVYFDLGIPEMQVASQRAIDSLIYIEKLVPGKKIGIVGYADYIGSEESNVGLSEKRAKNVQDYLVSMGMKATDIQMVIGRGEVSRPDTNIKTGYPEDRRVDIIPGGIKVVRPKPIPPPPPAPPKPVEEVMDIAKVKKNETIRLNNIYFMPGSHMVRNESLPELDKLYGIMKDNPGLEIQVEGHICCLTGNTEDGYDYDSQDFNLSKNRAQYIYDYLIEKGIDEDRLKYKGFGKKRPLVKIERTEEDENKNRRVEIRILKK